MSSRAGPRKPASGGGRKRCRRTHEAIQEQQTRGEDRAVDAGARSGLVGRGGSRSAETRASTAASPTQ